MPKPEAERIREHAKGEGLGVLVLCKMRSRAKGLLDSDQASWKGYKQVVSAAGGESYQSLPIAIIEKLPGNVYELQVEGSQKY